MAVTVPKTDAEIAALAPVQSVAGRTGSVTLSTSDISGLTTALSAKADLVGGYVPSSQIPAIAITEYLGSVANEAAMLALSGDRGDWCIRTDTSTAWVLSDDDSTLIGSWIQIPHPQSPVLSVNGQTGVITLAASDVGAQVSDTTLTALAGVVTSANKLIYATDSDTFSTTDFTSAARDLLDDANAGSMRTTLGLGSISTQASNNVTITGGSVTGITDIAVADGGTGASTEAAARVNLGVATSNNNWFDSAPAVGTVTWVAKSRVAFTINGVYGVKTTSGTCTFAVKINGTAVTGLSSVAATTSTQDVTASAANSVAVGDVVTIEYTAASSPANLSFTLEATR